MATDQITRPRPPAPPRRITREEYLAFELASDRRHEFADGEVREMTGASENHISISSNFVGLLWPLLRSRPLKVYANDLRVRIPNGPYYYPDIYYPDIAVAPYPPSFEEGVLDTLLDPLLILEVLSPSTERIDRGEKLDNYRRIPSLLDYLLVSQAEMRIDHYRRGEAGWTLEIARGPEAKVLLPSLNVELVLAEVYERVFPAET